MSDIKRLYRSNDRIFGGVCGGIAKYFDLDPTLIRVGYTLFTIFTCFSGTLAYILMWIIIPQNDYMK